MPKPPTLPNRTPIEVISTEKVLLGPGEMSNVHKDAALPPETVNRKRMALVSGLTHIVNLKLSCEALRQEYAKSGEDASVDRMAILLTYVRLLEKNWPAEVGK